MQNAKKIIREQILNAYLTLAIWAFIGLFYIGVLDLVGIIYKSILAFFNTKVLSGLLSALIIFISFRYLGLLILRTKLPSLFHSLYDSKNFASYSFAILSGVVIAALSYHALNAIFSTDAFSSTSSQFLLFNISYVGFIIYNSDFNKEEA